jgi:hypothetical protein
VNLEPWQNDGKKAQLRIRSRRSDVKNRVLYYNKLTLLYDDRTITSTQLRHARPIRRGPAYRHTGENRIKDGNNSRAGSAGKTVIHGRRSPVRRFTIQKT